MNIIVTEDMFNVYAQLTIIKSDGNVVTVGRGLPDYKCIEYLERESDNGSVVFNNLQADSDFELHQMSGIMYIPAELSDFQKKRIQTNGVLLQKLKSLMIVSPTKTYVNLFEFGYDYGLVSDEYMRWLSQYIQANCDKIRKYVQDDLT